LEIGTWLWLLIIQDIFEYADKHDFTAVRPEYTYFETDTVRVKKVISLDQVSEPLDKVGTFVTHENAIYAKAKEEFDKREKPLPQLTNSASKIRYRVRSGDYLGLIARKYGVRVSQIKQWNGLRNNNLSIGKYLTIYPRNPGKHTKRKSKPVVPKVIAGKKSYKVRSGDSLWTIAQKHSGVSVANLKKWNSISSNRLKPGMILQVEK